MSPAPDFSKAIPTVYAGVQMRSRMEAQCALLFDRLGWKWKYEPFSIMLPNGEAYTPDFAIGEGRSTIVECRGYTNAKGGRQIDGFIQHLILAENTDERYVNQYCVIGPESCFLHRIAKLNAATESHPLAFTYCPNCAKWQLSFLKFSDIACPSCIGPTFHERALTVQEGKLLLDGIPSDGWDIETFSHEAQKARWAPHFIQYAVERCRFDGIEADSLSEFLADYYEVPGEAWRS